MLLFSLCQSAQHTHARSFDGRIDPFVTAQQREYCELYIKRVSQYLNRILMCKYLVKTQLVNITELSKSDRPPRRRWWWSRTIEAGRFYYCNFELSLPKKHGKKQLNSSKTSRTVRLEGNVIAYASTISHFIHQCIIYHLRRERRRAT